MRSNVVLGVLALLSTYEVAASADPIVLTRGGSAKPWLIVSPSAARSTGATAFDPEARARAALPAAARTAEITRTTSEKLGDGETIVHFEQTLNGLPVIGRGAVVRLSASGDALLTAVDLEDNLPASTLPGIAPGAAAKATAARVPFGIVAERDAHLVVWPLASGATRLAYVVLPEIPDGIPIAPRFVVDAQTGKILEARDLVVHSNATVYQFNPITTPNLTSVALPIDPTEPTGKLSNDFITTSNCIDNHTVRPVSFDGFNTNVHVCDLQQVATADTDGNYVYAPADVPDPSAASDTYSEVSMYYHATKAYEFYRGLAGTPDAQVTVDKPLRTVSNLQIPDGLSTGDLVTAADPTKPLQPFQNAFFSPAGGGLGAIFSQIYGVTGGALWFGQGPRRDYSYDGDVIYHEFTHAVVDNTIKLVQWHVDAFGAIDSPGAMNEGLADSFSCAITGDPNVGEYAAGDIDPTLKEIRTVANSDSCPSTLIGEVHYDSTLFSGGLWSARSSLAEADRTTWDASLYKAMRLNPGRGDLGYDDLVQLFSATLMTDLPAGYAALQKEMTTRGVLPSCNRVLEYQGKTVSAPAKDLGGFAAPGTQSITTGDTVPGLFQLHVNVATTTTVAIAMTVPTSTATANPLTGGGTPFAPLLLAKFGKTITWTSGAHDADAKLTFTGSGTLTASIDVPAGATDLYLQIANTGETDGVYDDVALTLTPEPVTPPPGDTTPPAATTSSDSGCGCSTPGQANVGSGASRFSLGLLAALAMAAGVIRRRRGE